MPKNKKKILKNNKPKPIGMLLNKVYDNFKKKQKNINKKEIKLKEEQIKKEIEKILEITSHLVINRTSFKTRSENVRHIISLFQEVLSGKNS